MEELIKQMLKNGYNIEYGQLSICQIKVNGWAKWQVYCDNYRYHDAMIYEYNDEALDSAVRDFMNIKNGLDRDNLKNSKRRDISV